VPAPKLAVVMRSHAAWVPAIAAAEPRLDVRGIHPTEAMSADGGWLSDARALFTWNPPSGFLARMPALQWIQNGGAGVDHLLTNTEIPPRVLITRADGLFGFWMARYVIGHLLYDAERIAAARAAQAERRWDNALDPENLTNRTALVVGFGRIGRQIGRALRELGMVVRGFVRSPRADEEFELHGVGELRAHLGAARVLVLSAPLTPETNHLISAKVLAHGNSQLTLVNVGRGKVIATADLIDALDRGTVGRAVLDVFEEEPLPSSSPLWTHPRVTVTPHHSGPSTPSDMVPDMIDNLRRYADGQPIVGAVDRVRGY
jgi:glyoxylate/hydroxypyruvate reductase A